MLTWPIYYLERNYLRILKYVSGWIYIILIQVLKNWDELTWFILNCGATVLYIGLIIYYIDLVKWKFWFEDNFLLIFPLTNAFLPLDLILRKNNSERFAKDGKNWHILETMKKTRPYILYRQLHPYSILPPTTHDWNYLISDNLTNSSYILSLITLYSIQILGSY